MRPVVNPPGKAKFTLGLVFLFLCLPCDALGVGMMACPTKEGDPATGFGLLVAFSFIFGVPAAVLLYLGKKEKKRGRALDHITALASASARLPLQQVASDLGVTVADARRLLMDAIHEGRIAGRLDLEAGTFISGTAHAGIQKVSMRCRACGGQAEVVVGAGFSTPCPFCGAQLA